MLNFGASKPRVKGGSRPLGPPLDPHLQKHEKHNHNSSFFEKSITYHFNLNFDTQL